MSQVLLPLQWRPQSCIFGNWYILIKVPRSTVHETGMNSGMDAGPSWDIMYTHVHLKWMTSLQVMYMYLEGGMKTKNPEKTPKHAKLKTDSNPNPVFNWEPAQEPMILNAARLRMDDTTILYIVNDSNVFIFSIYRKIASTTILNSFCQLNRKH